ncbi:MAG TPA: regulatory protein RecX [Capsulimonadaceae bacterium]|nr:regulatory protein RecX [Capsulimonadaceae bacterium]
MPKITAITPQRKKGRFSIFVDDEFVVGVGEKVLADLGLGVGQAVTVGELTKIARAEEVRRATEAALRLLEVRPRAKKELETRLRQKGYEDQIISEAMVALTRWNLIDDAQFAAQWVESRCRSRPGGVRKLRTELFQKGIAKEQIEAAVGAISEGDELGLARQALAKKLRPLPADKDARREEYRRLAGFLQRRGFNWEITKKALAAAFEADPEEIGD